MKAIRPVRASDEIVVLVDSHTGGLGECIIRKTEERIRLGDQVYLRYRIIKPEGYEREEILHPVGRGTDGLIGTVFATMAQRRLRERNKSPRPRA